MTTARVLLVEDDPSVRRFVELALEDLPIQLHTCATVAEAIRWLAQGSVRLLITDLMLPDESGFALLRHLRGQAASHADMRVVAYSAGITPEVRAELESLGVWRTLLKPVPLATLCQCVEEAISQPATPASANAAQAPAGRNHAQAHALATYFAGNEQLFLTYRATCLQQFTVDVTDAEAAFAARDGAALRRLGHSLKTVLRTIGDPQASDTARDLEHAATVDDWPAIARIWPELRRALTSQQNN
jgi:DNA-binding NtrC family response regulator